MRYMIRVYIAFLGKHLAKVWMICKIPWRAQFSSGYISRGHLSYEHPSSKVKYPAAPQLCEAVCRACQFGNTWELQQRHLLEGLGSSPQHVNLTNLSLQQGLLTNLDCNHVYWD